MAAVGGSCPCTVIHQYTYTPRLDAARTAARPAAVLSLWEVGAVRVARALVPWRVAAGSGLSLRRQMSPRPYRRA